MRFATILLSVGPAVAGLLSRQIEGETLTGTVGNDTIAGSSAGPDTDGKYTIYGDGIRANVCLSHPFYPSPSFFLTLMQHIVHPIRRINLEPLPERHFWN